MYTNPFNRKHSTIRQVLDRILDPTRKPIRRSESVSSSGSNSSKGSNGSLSSGHNKRGILQWGRKWTPSRHWRLDPDALGIASRATDQLLLYIDFTTSSSYFDVVLVLILLELIMDHHHPCGARPQLQLRVYYLLTRNALHIEFKSQCNFLWTQHRFADGIVVATSEEIYNKT